MTPLREIEGMWEDVRAREAEFAGLRVRLTVLPPLEAAPQTKRRLSARELFKLPLEEREQILAEQFAQASAFYRNDPEMTDFEAFDESDLHDEYPENADKQ